ncbi:MAG: DUF1192 domain-containing protein [Rhizobiales bacterium]|nr:DUF1192 domain-containing protein [Hyphomicrobiales bacterium]
MEDDLEPGRKRQEIVLGEDLATLSIDELNDRISACESEIARIRNAIDEKQRSQAAASTFFRS